MVKTTSNKSSFKASEAKSSGKPPPRNKHLGLETDIWFYAIKYGDETEKGEESEILVIHDPSLAAYKQTLLKRKLSYIDTFDHEGPAVVSAMRKLTSGVFDPLEINYGIDVD